MEMLFKTTGGNKRKYLYDKFVVIFLIWSVLQDIVLGFLYTIIPSAAFIKILFYTKDVMMVLLFLYAIFFRIKNKNNKYFRWMAVYLFWVFLQFIIGLLHHTSMIDAMASLRGFILLPCFFVIGYSIKNTDYMSSKAKWFIGKFLIFVAILGICEFAIDTLLFSTKDFWRNTVGFTNYMTDIKGQGDRLVYGLPGNFYGHYGGEFFSQKRLVSLWGGPLTAGYVLMMPFIYYLIMVINNKKGWICFAISTISLILTYTRAMIVLCALLAFILVVFYKKKYKLLLIVIPLAIFVVVWKFKAISNYLFDGSTYGHIISVINSIKQVSLFGSGFGTFGIYSTVGTESAYISCLGQMGIIGLILYLGLNLYLAKRLRILYLATKDNFALALYVMQIIYLLSGFISEQLNASTTMLPFYIISGFYISEKSPILRQKVVIEKPKSELSQQLSLEASL